MELGIHVEIISKSDADWLWTVYGDDGALIDCGHEGALVSAREQILGTISNHLDAHLKKEWAASLRRAK